MKSLSFLICAAVLYLFPFACNPSSTTTKKTTTKTEQEEKIEVVSSDVQEKNGIKIYPLEGSPAYGEAGLTLKEFEPGEGSKASMSFDVNNFKLGEQTPGAGKNGLKNSAKGQHIHLIVNGGPYAAHYMPGAEYDFRENHHNVVLAFLSRSYHESVKNENAYALKVYKAGTPEGGTEPNLNQPMLFYSRPKGEYAGKDADKIMLDFYLINNSLGERANKVSATINGTQFVLNKWVPYIMEGLPAGDNKIKLELLDLHGGVIPSPFNTVERTITVVR